MISLFQNGINGILADEMVKKKCPPLIRPNILCNCYLGTWKNAANHLILGILEAHARHQGASFGGGAKINAA
jgi:hypothetical protein